MAAQDPRAGKIIAGRYQLTERLAEGGMGVVYLADRVGVGRRVVVKFLHAVLSDHPGVVDRFEREARATARLNHPNCVDMVDFGIEEGAPFLVMEYVEGHTLADLLLTGSVAPGRAVRIVRQLLAGLAHAHERGILHRDLKPANIMLIEAVGHADFVKILDFGLAKLSWQGAEGRDVTVEGIALGTPGYMSPEQAAGAPADRRADIFGAGALLYHLICGVKPFVGDDLATVLRRHREETPSAPRKVNPAANISAELDAAVMRALAKDPAARFQSAEAMADAISETPEGRGAAPEASPTVGRGSLSLPATQAESPSGRRRTRGVPTPALWAGIGLLGGVIGTALILQRPSPRVTSDAKHVEVGGAARPLSKVKDPAADVAALAPTTVLPALPLLPTAFPSPDGGNEDPENANADDGSGEDDQVPPPAVAEGPRGDSSRVRNLADVRALLRRGDEDSALSGLYRLRSRRPNPSQAAEIATLIGHIYFQRHWWTDGLKEYRFAIHTNRRLRGDATLVSNAVKALGDRGTVRRAERLLIDYVGTPALPGLRQLARNPAQKKRAQKIVAAIFSKRR